MAREAAAKRGRMSPTTKLVHINGRDIPVEELTPDQLEAWRGLRSAERVPNIWEKQYPCVVLR